jgi:hypothetical protein
MKNYTDKSIAFISELPFTGKVLRDHPHMRTEFAQICALKADHYNFYDYDSKLDKNYDHIILLISKTDTLRDYLYNNKQNLVSELKKFGNKIWFMQEATAQVYQRMPLHHQIYHYNILQEVDAILTENTTDFNYFRGLVGSEKQIDTIPTLIIEDNFKHLLNTPKEEKAMIGGNCNAWYGGFDSYVTALQFDVPISVPKMRNVKNEDQFINLLPHVSFNEWMELLSSYKYAAHLMPNVTAGTFALNCAFLGIPCISYAQSDPQRLCQPELSIEKFDLETAIKLAKRLKNDQDFYQQCVVNARKNYIKHYSEEVFLQHMNKVLQ